MYKTTKKALLMLVTLLALASTLFAGGSSDAKEYGEYEKLDTWLVDEPTTVTVLVMDSAMQPIKNYAPAQQEIFRLTGIKLDYQIVPFSSYDEKKNVLLATNNWPDIAYVRPADLPMYAPVGIFEPLLQYVNEETMPNFYRFWTQYPDMKNFLVDGELYAFPVIARDESANGFGPVIRKDLLEKHNIPIPETFDELLDVLDQLHQLYPDVIPYTGRKGTSQLLKTTSYMLGSGYGSNGLYYDHDLGKYVFGPATQEFKAVLSWLNEAYERGILDPDFATSTAEQMESKLSSGRALFFLDNSGFGVNYTKALNKIEGYEDAVFQIIPIPENSFGVRRAESYAKDLTDRFYAVNASSKNKEAVIKLIDWLYSDYGSDISNYGVEGYSFEYNEEGEPEFLLSYLEQFRDASPSSYYAVYEDLGVTKLNFCLYACNTRTWFEIEKALGNWDEVSDEYWNIVNNDDAYVPPKIAPALTTEESERSTDILMELTTVLEQEYNKYIMGIEPIENWDSVIAHCEELGARELEDIYNTALARTNAN